MDLNNITRLRLAAGSYPAGSGKGCAMNAVCYLNGDAEITDFPACSARPLAAFVQWCNDALAGPDGYLSPHDSVLALELALQTVGTAEVPDTVIHAWVAELLTSPTWGVIRYVIGDAATAICDIAELHRKAAASDTAPVAAWGAADCAARTLGAELDMAGRYAVRAAYHSTAPIDTDHGTTLDVVTGNALRAHASATAFASAGAVEMAGHAIRAWRRLAGMDSPAISMSA
ncbi:MAG: hypothetical protein ACRDTV_10550 [Mycobacterium sp.]